MIQEVPSHCSNPEADVPLSRRYPAVQTAQTVWTLEHLGSCWAGCVSLRVWCACGAGAISLAAFLGRSTGMRSSCFAQLASTGLLITQWTDANRSKSKSKSKPKPKPRPRPQNCGSAEPEPVDGHGKSEDRTEMNSGIPSRARGSCRCRCPCLVPEVPWRPEWAAPTRIVWPAWPARTVRERFKQKDGFLGPTGPGNTVLGGLLRRKPCSRVPVPPCYTVTSTPPPQVFSTRVWQTGNNGNGPSEYRHPVGNLGNLRSP